jgi:hypothetical protein
MTCCGKQRQQYQAATQTHQTDEQRAGRTASVRDTVAYFEYTGRTSLTVMGPVTGKRYRFEAPGDIAAVDQMDRVGVAAVPNLRQVMNPRGNPAW